MPRAARTESRPTRGELAGSRLDTESVCESQQESSQCRPAGDGWCAPRPARGAGGGRAQLVWGRERGRSARPAGPGEAGLDPHTVSFGFTLTPDPDFKR